MKVSLNIIKQFTDVDISTDELVERINAQLGGVEAVSYLGEKHKDARLVAVAKCEKHPDADRLSVCLIDDNGVTEGVERDEDNLIQVVCGAPNVRGGMMAVWLPPNSVVPSTVGDKEPFVLASKELRGVMSHGMLASPKELDISSDGSGIIEVREGDMPQGVSFSDGLVGRSFAEVFGLDDTIIDIENKMFTHRPDLFGQLGVAREISAILGGITPAEDGNVDTRYENPDWYRSSPPLESVSGLELEAFNDAGEKVPRLMVVAMKSVEVKPSPLWLQCALVALGSKAINNIVDATNYVMLLTAQPTHAYDYDKLSGHKIGARMAKDGEKVTLLNSKEYELTSADIVIVDGAGPIGLGGIMGGGNSEVSDVTKNIVLEVANFDMYAVRKSSMRHGLFTDAVTRFNKGQSPLQNRSVINLLMTTIKDVSSAQQASDIYDLSDKDWTHVDSLSNELPVSASFINERLGINLTVSQIGNLLRRVNFASYPTDNDDNTLLITAPFWRTDIVDPEDIVEEVGRLYGFDKLPRELPKRSTKPAAKNVDLVLQKNIREDLSRAGANEVLTYSFIHENTIKRAEQNKRHAYQLSNALSPDLQYYRLSLTPSLLDKVHMNIKAGYNQFALFETNKVHYKTGMDEKEPRVPNEDQHVAVVVAYSDKHKPSQAPYFYARNYLEQISNLREMQLSPLSEFDLSSDEWGEQLTAPYDPKRSAVVVKDNQIWGVVGEFKQSVKKSFKLPTFAAGFELRIGSITKSSVTYVPLPRFPKVTQDISLKVSADVPYKTVHELVASAIAKVENCHVSLVPITIYRAEGSDTKTITLRLTIASYEKTLTDKDVNSLLDAATLSAAAVGAERV